MNLQQFQGTRRCRPYIELDQDTRDEWGVHPEHHIGVYTYLDDAVFIHINRNNTYTLYIANLEWSSANPAELEDLLFNWATDEGHVESYLTTKQMNA